MNGFWICTKNVPEKDSFYYFKKKFTLEREMLAFDIKISADTRYRLYINDNFVCEGPCQGGEDTQYYEVVNASKFLVKGENEIKVTVLHMVSERFATEYRRNRPAIWFCGTVAFLDGTAEDILSDEKWLCAKETGIELFAGKGHHSSMPPMENVAAQKSEISLEIEKMYEPHPESTCFDRCGGGEKYLLEARPIQIFEPEEEKALAFVRKTYTDGKISLEFDAELYTTDFIRVRYKGAQGTKIRVIYAECKTLTEEYENDEGEKKTRTYKNLRDDESGVIDGAFDVLEANGEWQEHTFFWYRAFRYIRIECECEFEARVFGTRYVYPFVKNADGKRIFFSSDKTLEKMWDVSVNTVECCTHETFIDCPYYEQAQYIMDGMLESLFAFRISDDFAIQKKFLVDTARCQTKEGLIPAKAPCTFDQIIPSFSLFWIMALREYLRYTGDAVFVRTMIGVADKALECFNSFIDERGLIGKNPYWNFVDWVPGWSYGAPKGGREALTVYSMMYAAALEDAAQICDYCGRKGLSKDYRERKKSALEAINRYCYDAEKGMYADIPNAKSFSRHTTVWAVLSGAVEGEKERSLLERTLSYSDVSLTTFSMNYFTFRAMEKAEVYEKYATELFDGWRKMLDMHCTTWCENPDSPRSECHGWSSTPIYEFSAMLLGVYPAENGFKKVRIKPIDIFGSSVSGRVPIKDGYIDIDVERTDGALKFFANASRALDMEIILPGHDAVQVNGDKYFAEISSKEKNYEKK